MSSSNFCHRIADSAARFADRVAIERVTAVGLEQVTFARLVDDARRWAMWLASRGFARGDRAAILADNSADWISAYLGILWIGGVAVPLDTAYKAAQVGTVLTSSGARMVFTTTRYLETARAATRAPDGAPVTLVLIAGEADGVIDRRVTRDAAPHAAPADVQLHDAAVMLFTSGTTADPKGVVLTHGNLDAERAAALAVIDASDRDAVLGVLPLFHALAQMANLLLPLSVGARVVFLETVSTTSLVEALAARNISIFACVPQFFYLIHQRVTAEVAKSGAWRMRIFRAMLATNRVLRDRLKWNPGRRWFTRVHTRLGPSMRVLVTGGSRFDEAIGRDLYALGFTILNAYGLTETSGGATVQRPNDRFTTSVGPPLPGVEVRIGPAESEGDGEILIRGPIVMREYYGRPDATCEALDTEGWLHTGDLGRLDDAGRLYITGRKKEIIVLSSGKNLYPEEIEAHYRHSPFIGELCVLGLAKPGEPAAERLHAVIVPNADAMRAKGIVNIGDAIRFEVETWSASLPAHKRILGYDIVSEPLPRTTTGKLRRHEIEKQAIARAASSKTAPADRPIEDADRAWIDDARHAPLVATIAERLAQPRVHPSANLELDLGLDSMERVELLTQLERQAGTRVSADARATIFTVRQLVDAVVAGAAASGPEAVSSEPAWSALLGAPIDPAIEARLSASRRFTSWLIVLLSHALLRIFRLFVRLRVTGREHLTRDGAYLICPSHQTFLDGFVLSGLLPWRVTRRMFSVGASELFETRASKAFARFINLMPIDPDSHLIEAMQASAAGLRMGKVLLLFPEGERTIDGELKRFRKGAAILAGQLAVPVVPVAIDGLFPIWPRGKPVQWGELLKRRTVTISAGPAIPIGRDETAGTEMIRQAVLLAGGAGLQPGAPRRG